MPCLSAAVSIALTTATVQVAGPAAAPAPAAAAPAAAPAEASTPWRCGDNQAKYRPADKDAASYWRAHTPGFVKAGPDQRISILAAAWTSTKDPCFLYFLYRANDRQGHYLEAYTLAQQLQALGAARTPADVGDYVLQMLEGSKDCDVELKLDDVAMPESAEITATYEGLVAGDDLTGRCALTPCSQTLTLTERSSKQAFRVGTWTFAAGPGTEFSAELAAGGPADRRTVVVDHCGTPRALVVKTAAIKPNVPAPVVVPVVTPPPADVGPTPQPPVATARPLDMRRLSNAGIGLGAGLVVGGVVVLAVGAARWTTVYGAGLGDECNSLEQNGTALCRGALAGPTQLRGVGAGVFGAGAGLLVPAMVLRHSSPDRRATWLPIVGGVVTVAGAALIGVAATAFNRMYGAASTTPWQDRSAGSMHLHTVGAALTGFGVGLLTAALARRVWRGKHRTHGRVAVDVVPGRLPGGASLALSGRF